MDKIQPLKQQFKINEDEGWVPDQIRERVRSEDNFTNCKGYYLTTDKIYPDTHFLNDGCGELAHNNIKVGKPLKE